MDLNLPSGVKVLIVRVLCKEFQICGIEAKSRSSKLSTDLRERKTASTILLTSCKNTTCVFTFVCVQIKETRIINY